MVLLAPSWFALQKLIDVLSELAAEVDMTRNILKTVCTIFDPKAVRCVFPKFSLKGLCLNYVFEFKYLGHMLSDKLSDDDDIKREVRSLFDRSNILLSRFGKCSVTVELTLSSIQPLAVILQ